ncbi:MAG: hypothetical protein M1324_02010 [Patescibacteria group bacterium]|nr:hypothetical protein [Patescibacteria group bacterium]
MENSNQDQSIAPSSNSGADQSQNVTTEGLKEPTSSQVGVAAQEPEIQSSVQPSPANETTDTVQNAPSENLTTEKPAEPQTPEAPTTPTQKPAAETPAPLENTKSEQPEEQPQTSPIQETSTFSPDSTAATQQPEVEGNSMLQGNIPAKSSNMKIIIIALVAVVLIAGGYFVYQYLTNK